MVTFAKPWESDPYRLISWWDMEQFSATAFYQIGFLISEFKESSSKFLETISRQENLASKLSGDVAPQHKESLNECGRILEEQREKYINNARRFLSAVEENCEKIGLRQSVKSVQWIRSELEASPQKLFTEIGRMLDELDRRITDEIVDNLFMYIPPARAERYGLAEPFGDEVGKNFPSAAFDAKEAGNCFASGRSTACVFHLMRVLEIGLISFAGLFPGVPTTKENWQQIIEKIESEIRRMPRAQVKPTDWKEKQEKYSQIASSFMFFKDAWRNYTAHARGKYTEEEADAIYRNVGSFMKGLAAQGISE